LRFFRFIERQTASLELFIGIGAVRLLIEGPQALDHIRTCQDRDLTWLF